jgi:F-type H+-transporting ATPase subunit b
MLIDWFTVIAQIVNFLILMALLKHFLYGRIIRAMDEREAKIRSRMEEADEKKEEAEREAQSLHEKRQRIDAQREEMLDRAKEAAETRRKELIQSARQEIETMQHQWRDAIRQQEQSFIRGLRALTGKHVYALARSAFRDIAGADFEKHAIHTFLAKVREKEAGDGDMLGKFGKDAGNGLVIITGFEIIPEVRTEIERTLQEHISEDIDITYKTAPEAIFGIELRMKGRKLAWSLDDYMDTLEASAREALEEEARDKETRNKSEAGTPEKIA